MSEKDFSPQDLDISEQDWWQVLPSVQAVMGMLQKHLAKIEEQIRLNSDTSSRPLSSDKPQHKREKKGKPPSGKKHSRQPGHTGTRREPLPPEQVNEFRVYTPGACLHCGEARPFRLSCSSQHCYLTRLPTEQVCSLKIFQFSGLPTK